MTGCEGQDWASYQADAPSTAGLSFVLVKATESTTYVNPRHAAQIAHARAEGVVAGHYHFQRPGSPTAQAAYFLQHAAPEAGDVLACDWEDAGVSCADKDSFIKAVQKAQPGLRVLLYCNKDFWLHRDTTSFYGDGLWIADPSSAKGKPGITAQFVIHQYSEVGGVDHNYSPMAAAEFRAWANKQEEPVTLGTADLKALINTDDVFAAPPDAADYKTNKFWTWQSHVVNTTITTRATKKDTAALLVQVASLQKQVTDLQNAVAALTDPAGFVAKVAAGLADLQVSVTTKS